MDAPSLDTSAQAHEAQITAYRRMGGAGRTEVVFRLNELARNAAEAGIRSRHPAYSDAQVRLALARLQLGDELTRAVWPAQPLVEP
ncbi:MAG: hypothetical protein AB7O37_00295 [Vicinamibacteria bacterium]